MMTHPYTTEAYAKTFSHVGEEIYVPPWKTYVIKRPIKSGFFDALGIYPIAVLNHNIQIEEGLNFLQDTGIVSVTLVLDNHHHPDINKLRCHFNVIRPFKTHYLYNPEMGVISYDKHHRYELRQALKYVRVDVLELGKHLDEWIELYQVLTLHHNLTGIHNFPRLHHETLAKLDGIKAFGAWIDNQLVSCHIWALHDGYAHSHLAASNEMGYKTRAAYALNNKAIDYFQSAKMLNFGGGAGYSHDKNDGLAKFKQGFSNQQADSYICGAILDIKGYDDLVRQLGFDNQTDFFPAYRAVVKGEKK